MIKSFDAFYHALTGLLIGLCGFGALHYSFMRSGPVPLDLSYGLVDGFPVITPDASIVAVACLAIGGGVLAKWLAR